MLALWRADAMRLAVLALLAGCSSSAPPPTKPPPPINPLVDAGTGKTGEDAGITNKVVIKTPFSLVVFDLEVIGNFNAATTQVAKDFTAELRTAAHEYDAISLGSPGQQLIDHKLMFNCESEAPDCMAKIARHVQADRIIYGNVQGPPFRSTLKLLVADTKYVIEWSTDNLEPGRLRATAREAMASLLSRSP
jgi:hypothetical protein